MNNCPICDKEINISNSSFAKVNNQKICLDCFNRLSKKFFPWDLKKQPIEKLRKIVKDMKIANGEIIECPNCQSHNIDVIATDKNYKEKYKTTLNLNPLKIFTLTNTKKVVKETSKEHNEYLCKNCGNRWIGK